MQKVMTNYCYTDLNFGKDPVDHIFIYLLLYFYLLMCGIQMIQWTICLLHILWLHTILKIISKIAWAEWFCHLLWASPNVYELLLEKFCSDCQKFIGARIILLVLFWGAIQLKAVYGDSAFDKSLEPKSSVGSFPLCLYRLMEFLIFGIYLCCLKLNIAYQLKSKKLEECND